MAGNNRMISPPFASPTNLLIRKFSRCLDGNVSGRIKVTSSWTLVDLQAPTLSRFVPAPSFNVFAKSFINDKRIYTTKIFLFRLFLGVYMAVNPEIIFKITFRNLKFSLT